MSDDRVRWTTASYDDPEPSMEASVLIGDYPAVIGHVWGDVSGWEWTSYLPGPVTQAKVATEEEAKGAVEEIVRQWGQSLYREDD